MVSTIEFYDHLFKVLLVGEPGVGKTSLLARFADDTFDENATAVDFKSKFIELDGKVVKLQVWDTAGGHKRFKTIAKRCCRGTQGILLVYDVTRKASFNALKPWLREVDRHVGLGVKKLLVANKCDLQEEGAVGALDVAARSFAEKWKMPLVRASCKTNVNVAEVFTGLAAEIIKEEEEIRVHKGYESLSAALDRIRQRIEDEEGRSRVGDGAQESRAIVGDTALEGGTIVGDTALEGGAIAGNITPEGGVMVYVEGTAPAGAIDRSNKKILKTKFFNRFQGRGPTVGDGAPEDGAIVGDGANEGGAIVGNGVPVEAGATVGTSTPEEGGAIVGTSTPEEGGAIVGTTTPEEGGAIVVNGAQEGGAIVNTCTAEGGVMVNAVDAELAGTNNRRVKNIKTRVFKGFQGRGRDILADSG